MGYEETMEELSTMKVKKTRGVVGSFWCTGKQRETTVMSNNQVQESNRRATWMFKRKEKK